MAGKLIPQNEGDDNMKKWKIIELKEVIERFRKIYWKKIQLKDRLIHKLFEGTIEKFGIACFVYAYQLGLDNKKKILIKKTRGQTQTRNKTRS